MVIAFKYILCVVHLVSQHQKCPKSGGPLTLSVTDKKKKDLACSILGVLVFHEESSSKRYKSDPIFAHSTVTKQIKIEQEKIRRPSHAAHIFVQFLEHFLDRFLLLRYSTKTLQ